MPCCCLRAREAPPTRTQTLTYKPTNRLKMGHTQTIKPRSQSQPKGVFTPRVLVARPFPSQNDPKSIMACSSSTSNDASWRTEWHGKCHLTQISPKLANFAPKTSPNRLILHQKDPKSTLSCSTSNDASWRTEWRSTVSVIWPKFSQTPQFCP